jgi:hypothetical protein
VVHETLSWLTLSVRAAGQTQRLYPGEPCRIAVNCNPHTSSDDPAWRSQTLPSTGSEREPGRTDSRQPGLAVPVVEESGDLGAAPRRTAGWWRNSAWSPGRRCASWSSRSSGRIRRWQRRNRPECLFLNLSRGGRGGGS